MDYFAGLDISMDETHVCVRRPRRRGYLRGQVGVDGGGDRRRVGESAELSSDRLRDRTHGADPVPRVEPTRPSRGLRREPAGLPGAQVACDPQDRSQRRARAGASGSHRLLQARAREVFVGPRRPLADHRAQEAGRAARDLGKSDPRPGGCVRGSASSRAHRRLHRSGSQGKRGDRWSLCRHAGTDCGANRGDDGGRGDRRRHEAHDEGLGRLPSAHDNPRRRPTDRARLCRRNRRSVAHPPIARRRRLSGPGSKTLSVRGSRLCRRHLEMRRPAGADPAVRGRQRHADPLQGPAQAEGLGLRNRQAINACARRGSLWRVVSRSSCTPCCGTERSSSRRRPSNRRDRRPHRAPARSDARGREQTTARILSHAANQADCVFNLAALHPAYPIKRQRARREHRHPKASKTGRASALDPLENKIRRHLPSAVRKERTCDTSVRNEKGRAKRPFRKYLRLRRDRDALAGGALPSPPFVHRD